VLTLFPAFCQTQTVAIATVSGPKPLRHRDSGDFNFKILPFDKKIKRVTVSLS
jgi:hypothetical protein